MLLTLILVEDPSDEIFFIKFKNIELPSFKISLFCSKRSENTNNSKTPSKSVNLIIA